MPPDHSPPRDPPFYFPLGEGYSVGQAAPLPLAADQYNNGAIDGRVFQFDPFSPEYLQHKRDLLARHADRHVGRTQLSDAAHATACRFIIRRLTSEYPDRFHQDALTNLAFEDLALLVPEDLAITCARYDEHSQPTGDWLAAAHVCMPSGWDPADQLGQSFAQIHRTVQVTGVNRFLLQDGKVKDYVGQMMRCTTPHARFIWTLQVGDALNRNPNTRAPAPPLEVDAATDTSNVYFRVERQTITAFPDAAASLFTIRTYLYPLQQIANNPAHRAALKQAVATMPPRVVAYKGWGEALVNHITHL